MWRFPPSCISHTVLLYNTQLLFHQPHCLTEDLSCASDSRCLFWFSTRQQPIFPFGLFTTRVQNPQFWLENIFLPRVAKVSIQECDNRGQCKWTDICKEKKKKTKPGTSLWCEIGHLKGINDGSFQHNCLIMPGRWGTALTRTHCATSLGSPQQKANQCDSLFSNEWEGEWKKENGERRRGRGTGSVTEPFLHSMLPQKQMYGVNTVRITAPGRRITAV